MSALLLLNDVFFLRKNDVMLRIMMLLAKARNGGVAFRQNRIKYGRSIVKNSVSAVALCNFRSIKVENLRFSPLN